MDTQTIYEIFRSCRLCGAGGGYKMPIIQSVVPGFDGSDVDDLCHKIRECIQLEVTHDDKMPPLICELCVDKVNDFYEFLEMAHNVNKRTRQRLGLHQTVQTTPNNSEGTGDCILGVTEPVYDRPLSPASTHTKAQESKKPSKSSAALAPKGRKREAPDWAPEADDSTNSRNAKRTKEVVKHTTTDAGNKLKIIIKHPIEPEAPRTGPSRPGPKSSKQAESRANTSQASKHKIEFEECKPARAKESMRADSERREESNIKQKGKGPHCDICGCGFKSVQGLANHLRAHTVTFTNPKAACAACGEWFESEASAILHHQWHKQTNVAYRCRRCHGVFKRNLAYTQHIWSNCVPWPEVPDVTCVVCGKTFVTEYLRDRHPCKAEAGRQAGQCKWCKRSYATYKTLTKHESTCSAGKKTKEDTSLATLKKKDESLLSNLKKKDESLSNMKKRDESSSNLKKKDESSSNLKKKDESSSNLKKKDESLSNLKKKVDISPASLKKKDKSLSNLKKKVDISPASLKKKDESLSNLKKKENISLASLKKKDESNLRKKVEPPSNVKKNENISLSSLKKKKESPGVPPSVRRRLLPMRVLVGRCDSLLTDGRTANVARVPTEFGLDSSCVYPYHGVPAARVKTERWSQDDMVRLQDNHDYREEDYIHWDSDLEGDDDEQLPRVDSLMTLTLKTIFSKRCLGKVPRKLRKIQPDKNLDSLFNNIEDFSVNISSIIETLGQDDNSDKVISDKSDTSKVTSDVDKGFEFGSDSLIITKANDFDSLFSEEGKVNDDKSEMVSNKNIAENETDASVVETVVKSDITSKCMNESNLDGFDIDTETNGQIKTVNGENRDDKIVIGDAKPYLDRISDEEFNFDV